MKIILTYNFADEAVNGQNTQTQSIKEQKVVESPVKENNKEEDNKHEQQKQQEPVPVYREYNPEKDEYISNKPAIETYKLQDALIKHGHNDKTVKSFRVYNTGHDLERTSISVSDFREAMIGKDRLGARNKLAYENRAKNGGAKRQVYNPNGIDYSNYATRLLSTRVPYMGGKDKEQVGIEEIYHKFVFGSKNDRIPYNSDIDIKLSEVSESPAFYNSFIGSVGYFTPGFTVDQIKDYVSKRKDSGEPKKTTEQMKRAILNAQGISDLNFIGDPKSALGHEIYHALGKISYNGGFNKHNSVVLPKQYEEEYLRMNPGENPEFYNSYVSYDHNEAIPGLFINKDELQQHNPDIVDPKQIETFDQIEKLFQERTYVDPKGVIRHRDDNSPVSEEMMRVWRMIEIDPKAKQIYQYYAPFVKNSHQYHQSKQLHA